MDPRLVQLIARFRSSVAEAVALIERSGISRPSGNTAWACNGLPKHGQFDGGIPYLKHGYGISVQLPSGEVDFDFGNEGEIDGFDEWRLTWSSRDRLAEFGFGLEEELKEAFKAAVQTRALRQRRQRGLFYVGG